MNVVSIGLNHHSAPLDIRSRFAVAQDSLGEHLRARARRCSPRESWATANRLRMSRGAEWWFKPMETTFMGAGKPESRAVQGFGRFQVSIYSDSMTVTRS